MHIHYLQHVDFEGPGYIRTWAEQNGHSLIGTHLYKEESLPQPDNINALVVMGGPMGVYYEQQHSWLNDEKEFIASCINKQKKVLGICLGAQLIADLLGAEVSAMDHNEIGWFPLKWSDEARNHPTFSFLPGQQQVLHWHGDMFEIPNQAVPMGSSKACTRQGFFIPNHILGLQFHLEMTREGLANLIEHSDGELQEGPFIQQPNEMLNSDLFTKNHETMGNILDNFLLNNAE
ncbi:type 1 glutamine amidotransferase [Fodinibius halophilus]|uniref:Type 1 glutamine amidotransferase n=1 Tax=Fodinibius halophilus TaxID=1736908 RepID=A0A6M1T3N7_9BACT|nr:type 1 glutamine amidotransferase [Fodinibius halophilus]NGP88699.1 type 1 glutamine amidotransferase [Fodinibius halophilus]